MMKRKAKIYWVSTESGGRKNLPSGPKYSTVARFKDAQGDWSKQAWSIVIELSEPPNESLCTIADISFLTSDAPSQLILPGKQFKLFEGAKLVAIGEVLL